MELGSCGPSDKSLAGQASRPLSVVLFGAVMAVLWLGVIPLLDGLLVQIVGLRFLSTLTGIVFMSYQAGSFLGAWDGGYLFDLMGSCDLENRGYHRLGRGHPAAPDERPADGPHAGIASSGCVTPQ
jgi:hypothetical protein